MLELDRKSKHFDILDGGLALAIFLLLNFVFYFFIGMLPGLPAEGTLQYNIVMNVLQILLEALFILAAYLVVKARKRDFMQALTLNKKINFKMIGFCLLISLVCLILFTNLTSAFMAALQLCGYNSPLRDVSITTFGAFLLNVVVTCMVPAFCEEVLFRGVVLNSLRSIGKWPAILISGLTFMLVHGNPDQTVHQFILGIVLAYVCWETKNLWVPITIHFFNNFIAVVVMYFSSFSANSAAELADAAEAASTQVTWGNVAFTAIAGIFGAVLGAVIIKVVVKAIKKYSVQAGEFKFGKAKNQVTDSSDSIESLLASPIAEGHLASSAPEGHLAESHRDLRDDLLSDGLSGHAGEFADDSYDSVEKTKPKLSGAQLAITLVCYAGFATYFIYEWVHYLLIGLGL